MRFKKKNHVGLTLPVSGRTFGYFQFTQEIHVVKGLFCFLQYTKVYVTMTITHQRIPQLNDSLLHVYWTGLY